MFSKGSGLIFSARFYTHLQDAPFSRTNPQMTKDELGQFNGRSIRFTIGGLSFLGTVQHDSWRNAFKIIYPVVEEGRGRNEGFPLHTALIERITFDQQQNTLTLL